MSRFRWGVRGLIVTNTPEVLSDATAELTLMLMLGAARRASEGERLVRTREWKVVFNADGSPWLVFDLARDPLERRNLSRSAAGIPILRAAERRLPATGQTNAALQLSLCGHSSIAQHSS